MLTVAAAISQLTQAIEPRVSTETVEIAYSLGRVLATDIVATVSVPPADNSAMDGYAFCYSEAAAHAFDLPLSQRIAAGSLSKPLLKNTLARIFTGGEIPLGADTVAMQENCSESDSRVAIDVTVESGANIRPRGQDIAKGHTVIAAGAPIRAQEMGLLSSIGVVTVPVYQRLRVALFSSGDELIEPGRPLLAGQIYNSNRATMIGLVRALGMQPVDLGSVPDCPQATRDILVKAAVQGDVVLCSGGVSVGEEDHVKAAVAALGAIDFWRVAIKPGKPLAFGNVRGVPFIGLPGNPSSVFVTSYILARPFLQACQGHADWQPRVYKARAAFKRAGETREVYLRARLNSLSGAVEIFSNQSSGVLSSACWGDVFVRQKSGESIKVDDLVDVLPYSAQY
ncbi:MAG: molybdopterin molybdotransferase MoeA [Porticoccaceae bacterium]|nr:molybdopterin molybdotransferase MoeA [Porticoccaceae bacterium]